VAAHWQRPPAPNCHELAAPDTELSPSIRYIAERWVLVPCHIREAILTLVDAGIAARSEEGGAK
jgi:hypothetical protein